jgi:hypothetical protein
MALPNPTPKKVREDIGKLLNMELSTTEFDGLRSELTSTGFLAKAKRNSFSLTDAGRARALEFLGVSELAPRTSWSTVVNKHLFPKAAGLSRNSAAKLNNTDRLAAFLLRRKHALSASAGSTVAQMLEALACKELGFPDATRFADILRVVLSRLLKSEERLTKEQLLEQVPLFETGLVALNADGVRRKIVRDWLRDATTAPEPTVPFELAGFAAAVRALAERSPPADRFHDNKVFIAALWRASRRESGLLQFSLPEFKQRLIEANSHNLLHLSRADLVPAMDPQLVAESETKYLNATFHFVLLEEPRQ